MMNIQHIVLELLVQFGIDITEAEREYESYKQSGFEDFETTETYEKFDMVYGALAYDYLKEYELNQLKIYGTSDLIEYMCEICNKNQVGLYEIHDNVEDTTEQFETWNELKGYAQIWCDRLNEENQYKGERHRFDIERIEDIEEVFEACNISWHIVSVQTNN